MEQADSVIVELPSERTAHIRKHFPEPLSVAPSSIDLPYGLLGGDAFERLCALLLIADGQAPRYFGKRGTCDYGIDIVVSDGESCTVYQCKNVSKYARGDLSRWLKTFELAWLVRRPHLLKPVKYVLLCPLELREKDDIQCAQEEFYRRNEVRVEVWQKTLLDGRLKLFPDIIADLFSPTVADFFCSLDQRWHDGFTSPLAPEGRDAKAVDRFLGLHEQARFVRDLDNFRAQLHLLHDEELVAFVGASGAGKTMTALELARIMAGQGWRPWHVDMRNADPSRLYESIERRALRPSVFVLDDCHLALEPTRRLITRFRNAGLDRRARLLLTVTAATTSNDLSIDQGEISQFLAENIEPQQQIMVRPKSDTYRRIIETARPDLTDTLTKTVEHLIAITANDLFLLDQALQVKADANINEAIKLDTITVEILQRKVFERYFRDQYPSAPTIKRIAAVAQFDISVLKRTIEAPSDALRDRMLVSTGPPSGWLFTHVALAELIYSTLTIAEADEDPNRFAVDAIIAHGLHEMPLERWIERLTQVLRAPLKLTSDRPLKQRLLHDERISSTLHAAGEKVPLFTISLACSLTVKGTAPSLYLDLLSERIEKMLTGAGQFFSRDIGLFGMALQTMRLSDAERFENVLRRANPEEFIIGLATNAGLLDTLKILKCFPLDFADRLIEALIPDSLDALVNNTIAERRSAATIGVKLRQVMGRDGDQRQLAAFEARLGVARMIHIMSKRADLRGTMKILETVTPGFADSVMEALDPATLDELINNTINAKATNLRHLPLNRRFFGVLETQLSPKGWRRLLSGCGDLQDLSPILVALGPKARAELLEALCDGSSADWVTMLGRTDAFGFSVFCLDGEPTLNDTARQAFEDAAVAGMGGVMTRSDWSQLAVAHKELSALRRESRAKTCFLEHFRATASAIDFASPPAIDDLITAANLVQVLWHERAKERSALAKTILDIAPDRADWPLNHRRLTGTRLLIALAQSEEMPRPAAEHIFDACAYLPKEFDITTCNAQVLFLYLFNIWAVLIARAPRDVTSLVASQDKIFWAGLIEHIDTLATERNNEKKLNLLALVGLLEFTSVFSDEQLAGRVRNVVKGFPFLLDAAENLRAVTRFFAFRGLVMIGPPRLVNDEERIHRLLNALSAYDVQTPAMRRLRNQLSSRR